jgi:SNF2 family DNA or RNA helicase
MKTRPMSHQTEGAARLDAAKEYYALGAEQGTGKTWMLLADAERQFLDDRIDALLVIAPKGVHINWVKREIPAHLEVPALAEFWLSGANQKHTRKLARLLQPSDDLVILAMNIDAVNTAPGYEFAKQFLLNHRCMMVVDESQRIKNMAAKRTKRVIELGRLARSRRISSGTLVSNSPLDLFSQFEFLAEGLLGTRSLRAFTAEYAELLPPGHPLLQAITRGRPGNPQVVKRDKAGNPVYRNLDKLQGLIAPHTFRVLKSECLDLPDKIYQTQYFDLTPPQSRLYQELKKDKRYIREDGEIDVFSALTVINKLRQVTSGFIIVAGEAQGLKEARPRLDALKETIEDCPGQVIVWASFREELKQIATELKDYGVVEYHGGIGTQERERAVDDFQAGRARVFVGNPAAAGTGLTLTAASAAIYYSSSFSLEERLQSEDRCHRIGTRHPVVYIDIVARDTIDEKIAAALQAKKLIASEILDNL